VHYDVTTGLPNRIFPKNFIGYLQTTSCFSGGLMKGVLLGVLVSISTMFAGEILTVNGGVKTAQVASDMPYVLTVNGQRVTEDIVLNLQDLHNDAGPGMIFRVEVYGNSANGEVFTAQQAGDYTVTIPASLVGQQTVLVCFDQNRYVHGSGHQYVESPEWSAATMGIEALQDNPVFPELNVFTKDHHLGNPGISVYSLKIENVGMQDVSDLKVRYYFSVEDTANVPVLYDYYTPSATLKLLRAPGTKEYAIEYDFAGVTLHPGESTLGAVENQVHLNYAGYTPMNKFNDFSNPIPEDLGSLPSSTLFSLNHAVSVYDASGTLVAGMAHPQFVATQFVTVP
jgi:hypothetical protein